MGKLKEANCSHCGEFKRILAKGWCQACYQRNWKGGSLDYRRWGKRNRCTVLGCVRYVVTHGLCDAHRSRLARYGQLEPLRAEDWGKKGAHPLNVYWRSARRREGANLCQDWKIDFWKFAEVVKDRPSKNHHLRAVNVSEQIGPENWQWVEGLDKATRLEVRRQKTANYERSRLRILANEREALMDAAQSRCEVCGSEGGVDDCPTTGSARGKMLCVDHDHKTGRLRGILCRACNVAIGCFKDDVELLASAIQYLNRTKVQT